jgi:tRNA threonylcarbamoyladenosine biosynthesis protein TsaB
MRGEETLALREAPDGRQHAADVIELVDGVLSDAGWSLARVDGFAVAIGPGSFTRLRVGLATIKGLAFGGSRKVAAVSTLEAMAEAAAPRADTRRPLATALDARRGELYGAVFARSEVAESGWSVQVPESVYALDGWLSRVPADAVIVGEGAALCVAPEDAPRPGSGPECRPDWGAPSADAVGRLGARRWAGGHVVEADALVPRYLRRAEAEALRLDRALESV